MHPIRVAVICAGLAVVASCSSGKGYDPGTAPPPVSDETRPDRTVINTGPGDASSDGTINQHVPGMASGGAAVPDASRVTGTDAAVSDVASAVITTCDLLLQDCPDKQDGCYPLSDGTGRCRPSGSVGEMGQCLVGEDPPSCAPGLTCLSTASVANVCLRLCDLTGASASYACSADEPCLRLSGSTKVGYCSP